MQNVDMVEIKGLVMQWSQQRVHSIRAGCWRDHRYDAGPAEGQFNRAYVKKYRGSLKRRSLIVSWSAVIHAAGLEAVSPVQRRLL
jgi:hypothetical protein